MPDTEHTVSASSLWETRNERDYIVHRVCWRSVCDRKVVGEVVILGMKRIQNALCQTTDERDCIRLRKCQHSCRKFACLPVDHWGRKCLSRMYASNLGLLRKVEPMTLFFQIQWPARDFPPAAASHTRIFSSIFAKGVWQVEQRGAVIKLSRSVGGKNPLGGR